MLSIVAIFEAVVIICLLGVITWALRRREQVNTVDIHITLGSNTFDVKSEGEGSVIDDDFNGLFRLWVNAQAPDAVKLEELTDRLKSSTNRLQSAIDRNTPTQGDK